jgi:hypothetical protein
MIQVLRVATLAAWLIAAGLYLWWAGGVFR